MSDSSSALTTAPPAPLTPTTPSTPSTAASRRSMRSPRLIVRSLIELARARWRFRHLEGPALQQWQERHAIAIARYAQQRSRFYRELTQGIAPEEWRRFPVVDKAAMMARFQEFNTRNVSAADALAVALRSEETRDFSGKLDGLSIVLSSGTSGHRTISLVDDDEAVGFVGFMLARVLDGTRLLRRHRVAFFLRSNSNVYEASNGALIDFRYFDLTLTHDEIVARLGALQPDILVGPPALLCVVADLVDAGRLRIRPDIVFSGAEVLEPQDRAKLERVFGARSASGAVVREIYHTSEGPLGVGCREGRLHIPEDVSLVELEAIGDPAEGRYTPILTQLFRKVQPFIRYRMNDIVTLDERPCPCGSAFRVLARVEGRCDDILYLARKDGTRKLVFPDQVRRAIIESEGVREYRVEQLSPDRVRVHVERTASGAVDDVTLARTIEARMVGADGDCIAPHVDVIEGIPVESDKRRKLVRVRRLFALDTVWSVKQ